MILSGTLSKAVKPPRLVSLDTTVLNGPVQREVVSISILQLTLKRHYLNALLGHPEYE